MRSYGEVARTFDYHFIDEADCRELKDADLLKLQKSFGYSLPKDYTLFLQNYGGGSFARPVVAPIQEPKSPHETTVGPGVFFGFYRKSEGEFHDYDIRENLADYEDRMPPHMLPVGEDPGGNLICVSCGGNDFGKVYFWDHEEEERPEEGKDCGYSNLSLLAADFKTFISNLKKNPNYDDD